MNEKEQPRNASSYYWLYAAAIFVSSFLVFQVEPLIGKHILPFFGGSASVWVTALFFFMVALAVGYAYSLVLALLPRFYQLLIHGTAVIGTGVWIFLHSTGWSSGITPPLEEVAIGASTPALEVFWILSLSIGAPFVLLSATSTLLQYWYGVSEEREPFSLYAVSNVGSIAGLLSYPFLFEPLFPTPLQGSFWVLGYVLYAVLMFAVMTAFARRKKESKLGSLTEGVFGVSLSSFLKWTGVASVPIVAMLMGTDFVLGSVAAVPFLWVVPLALYLLSFVLAFNERWHMSPFATNLAVAIVAPATMVITLFTSLPFWITLLFVWAAIFFVSHWCHEWLYANRPRISGVPAFYVALSIGGIFASAGVLFIDNVLLPIPIEFLILLLVSAFIALYWLLGYREHLRLKASRHFVSALVFVFVIAVFSVSRDVVLKAEGVQVAERNFFGPKSVAVQSTSFGSLKQLRHGVTNHGYQYLSEDMRGVPSAYYPATSGVGKAFQSLHAKNQDGLSVAIGGLGSGALNSHCKDGDQFHYFEIDPEVIEIARENFTFLESCAGSKVTLGDARIELEKEYENGARKTYDMIILDAYADDSMPVHLMTTEAVNMYQKLLKDDGILAIHISSRYLDLRQVIYGNALANDMTGRYRVDYDFPDHALQSKWTLLAKNEAVFEDMSGLSEFTRDPIYWTDTYSAFLPVLRLK